MSIHSRVASANTRPPLINRSAGSSPRATASPRRLTWGVATRQAFQKSARVSSARITRITTHVHDTATGRTAAGLPVSLQREISNGKWTEIGQALIAADGHAQGLSGGSGTGPGRHCLVFDTAIYHEEYAAFFGEVIVTFGVQPSDEHLHIPLLLSPYGYSVYKSS